MCTSASGQLTIASIRAEMRRPLTEAELASYRGITEDAMTSSRFEKLFNVKTAEDLIKAQQHGITLRASDEPDTPYLFASGVGKVASYNAEYTAANAAEWKEKQPAEDKTLAQLDAHYRRTAPDRFYTYEETEEILNEVARYFVDANKPEGAKE